MFNLYVRNSIHNVIVGISVGANFSQPPPISWFLGNTYRGNTITGPAEQGSYWANPPAGISINDATTDDSAGILMNIFDQDTISDFPTGVLLYSTAGIVDAVLANDFFSSDGSAGSIGLTTDGDSTYYFPAFDFGTDTWQNFWDANSQEHG